MAVVNNVTRLLDSRKVAYRAFETAPEKLGARATADLLGVPAAQVFKTIVVLRARPGGKPVLAVVPGDAQADLKKIAALLGEKKMSLPSEREAEQLTGLQAGGISPLALMQRGFQVLIDESARAFPQVHVSGGQRGLNIALRADDLARLTQARFGPISSPEA